MQSSMTQMNFLSSKEDIVKDEKSITMYLVPFQFGGYSSLNFHQNLLQDSVRTDSFRKAILNEVKKNDIVLDVGSGTGVLSFFAYQAGAKKSTQLRKNKLFRLNQWFPSN